jgi:hypothetical protein
MGRYGCGKTTIDALGKTFLKAIIAETAYPFTLTWNDWAIILWVRITINIWFPYDLKVKKFCFYD